MNYYNNILGLLEFATEDDWAKGSDWYEVARELAGSVADQFQLDWHVVAGVIAALSPQQSWDYQVQNTGKFVEWAVQHKEPLKHKDEAWPAPHGGTNLNKFKAANIVVTGDVLGWLSGPKVVEFYHNICGDSTNVTLDIWAMRAALGDYKYNDTKNYGTRKEGALMRQAYLDVAQLTDLRPHQLQAIIWLVVKRKSQEA